MRKSVILAVLVCLGLGAQSSVAAPLRNSDTIPPNCTLDPFTGKEVCHIWPTCTLDPFTKKMNCPVPRPKQRLMGAHDSGALVWRVETAVHG
jgi:hypothetical protein